MELVVVQGQVPLNIMVMVLDHMGEADHFLKEFTQFLSSLKEVSLLSMRLRRLTLNPPTNTMLNLTFKKKQMEINTLLFT
jgi:hypothetical protein